jgi:hypothetical protein
VVSLPTPPATEELSYESAVAVARLNNGVVRMELVRFCTARMHVLVEPCCSTSNNSLMWRYQLIKNSKMHGLLSPSSDI